MTETAKHFEQPAVLAVLAMEALARYVASDLVGKDETMHEDLALRLSRTIDKDKWT